MTGVLALSFLITPGVVEQHSPEEGLVKRCQTSIPIIPIGLPKTLIEASACGRPVVTTDVPGCRDAIIPDVTGLLVQAKDITGLVEAIENLLNNKQRRLSFGNAGRKLAEEHFDINGVVDKHLSIYKSDA